MAAEFRRQKIPFFNECRYDLFYAGYGDSFPTAAFHAAGMTFEKRNADPYPRKTYEQYVAQWVSLSAASNARESILKNWAQSFKEAEMQGELGFLQPNFVYNQGNDIVFEVPEGEAYLLQFMLTLCFPVAIPKIH
jgi:hypothetical protein